MGPRASSGEFAPWFFEGGAGEKRSSAGRRPGRGGGHRFSARAAGRMDDGWQAQEDDLSWVMEDL